MHIQKQFTVTNVFKKIEDIIVNIKGNANFWNYVLNALLIMMSGTSYN